MTYGDYLRNNHRSRKTIIAEKNNNRLYDINLQKNEAINQLKIACSEANYLGKRAARLQYRVKSLAKTHKIQYGKMGYPQELRNAIFAEVSNMGFVNYLVIIKPGVLGQTIEILVHW